METNIDNKNGGPGKGWYRIVKTPDEAQDVIGAGKLAVVLGIEVDYLFGSYPNSGLTEGQVQSQLDKYYQMGVRHVFPIHFGDNAFGSASYDKPLQYDLNIGDSPTLSLLRGYPGPIIKPYKMTTQDASGPPYNYRFRGGRMNVQGLTNLGKFLITQAMAKGMIIDVDHTSYKSRSDILAIAESKKCPVVSGHTGFVDISNGDKRHEGNLLPSEVRSTKE
jgi:microsomal dipeptidase-like Zn-dependent dipeptidase